jgi:SAM-dependent methyltransferase
MVTGWGSAADVRSLAYDCRRVEDIDVNRRYFVHCVRRRAEPGAKVLDYGCGAGTVVQMLRDAGYDAYGVDIRWPGAAYGDLEAGELGRQGFLRYYEEGGRLPFDDDTFDVVISDQVLEHLVPLEASVAEIERVVKPQGVMYHHFPSRAVWREAHIGIPFAHRVPPGRGRLLYASALRRLGFGKFKDRRPAREWAREQLEWIDRWTVYRSRREIQDVLGRNCELRSCEVEYCRFRAGDRRLLRTVMEQEWLRAPLEAIFRRLAFEAIEARPR